MESRSKEYSVHHLSLDTCEGRASGMNAIHCHACGSGNQLQAHFCLHCGTSLEDAATSSGVPLDLLGSLAPQRQLSQRYTIMEVIGSGGMGTVYKAQDTRFGNRLVAVKEMSQSSFNPQQNALAVQLFMREAHLLASLNHPNLPRIYDHFSENGRWYLVMDFVEGETLEQRLTKAQGGTLPVSEALSIGIQLAKVLGYLHTRPTPIIFRDLKPLNVMITPDEHIYLIDFGIARLFRQGQSHDTVTYFSSGYAAPEQFGQAQTTPQSDIFSLGATLHRLLSGEDPCVSTSPFLFTSLQSFPHVPPALATLIAQMVDIQPSQRPTSMAVVRQQLEVIQRSQVQDHSRATTLATRNGLPQLPPYASLKRQSPPVLQASPQVKRIASVALLLGAIIFGSVWFLRSLPYMSSSSASSTNPTGAASPGTVATPATGVATPVSYPSQSNAAEEIRFFYENISAFKGKNVIQSFDSITYGPLIGPTDQRQFVACVQYKFAQKAKPSVTVDTARHTFTFQYTTGIWKVTDMGNWNSC